MTGILPPPPKAKVRAPPNPRSKDITNLFNPELSYDNIMNTAIDVVPRVNFVVPTDEE